MTHVRLAAALVVVSLAVAHEARADDGSAALALVPDKASMVAGVDVTRFKASPYYRPVRDWVLAKAGFDGRLDALQERLGVDLEASVTSALLVAPSGPPSGEHVVIILGGKLAAVDLTKLAGDTGLRRRGRVAYVPVDDNTSVAQVGAFLVVGHPDEVAHVIDVKAGKLRSMKKNRQFRRALASLSHDRDMWFYADAAALGGAGAGGPARAAASIDLAHGASVAVRLGFADEAAARTFHQQVRQAVDMLAQGGAVPGLEPVGRKLTVGQTGADVDLAVALDDGELDGVRALLGNL